MSENPDSPKPDSSTPEVEVHLPASAAPAADSDAGQKGHDELRISTRDEILYRLDQMPGLVAMGLLPTTKANAMKSIYQLLLASMDASKGGAAPLQDNDVLAVLRARPELFKSLQPFLTPGQIELIVREAQND